MLKQFRTWHLLLVYPAAIALLVYVVSALCHPLMAWTGPQTQLMHPPTLRLTSTDFEAIPKIITTNQLTTAKMAKYVAYEDQVLLQITASKNQPARYFSSQTLSELLDHDRVQAIWLANHFMNDQLPIRSVRLITEFSNEYPSINRLLPVYEINYDTKSNLSILIHTETQSVASITNDWKRFLRTVFQTFHSFTWLDNLEWMRVMLSILLLTVITAMTVTGGYLLLKLKRRKKDPKATRRWHKYMAYLVIAPLFLFSISGIYHLLHWTGKPEIEGLKLTETLQLNQWQTVKLPDDIASQPLLQVSLVAIPSEVPLSSINTSQIQSSEIQSGEIQSGEIQSGEIQSTHPQTGNTPFYRISFAQTHHQEENTRQKRFSGRPSEESVRYLNGLTGERLNLNESLIIHKQVHQLLAADDSIVSVTPIHRFGSGYDFRNKRLPVWQVDTHSGERLFVDPISHSIVDHNATRDRIEQLSFGFLHKWNVFIPIMGRFNRDMLVVVVLVLSLLLTVFGLSLKLRSLPKHRPTK